MMDKTFKKHIKQLPSLLKRLTKSELRPWSDLGILPEKGIYVFYELETPIYVGRTNNMRRRIKEHARMGSGQNKAPFAFNLAKKTAKDKGIDVNKNRNELEKDPAFRDLFTKAKEGVSLMYVRVIGIDDQVLQTLFEVYAALALKTTEYNYFDTH